MVKIVILKSRRELHRKVFTISEEETTGWTCLRRRKIIWFILLFWKFPFNHFKMFMCIKLHSDVWRNQEIWSLSYMIYVVKWSVSLFRFKDLFIFIIYLLFWFTVQGWLRFNLKTSLLFLTVISRVQYLKWMEIIHLLTNVGWKEKNICRENKNRT